MCQGYGVDGDRVSAGLVDAVHRGCPRAAIRFNDSTDHAQLMGAIDEVSLPVTGNILRGRYSWQQHRGR
jgi:hypothetical protein